jgi:hypothetical protein
VKRSRSAFSAGTGSDIRPARGGTRWHCDAAHNRIAQRDTAVGAYAEVAMVFEIEKRVFGHISAYHFHGSAVA